MEIQSLPVGSLGTNCYLVCDEHTKLCAIIDPGGDASYISTIMQGYDYTPCAILLTHGHYDHTGGVAGLTAQWSDVPVYLNHGDIYPEDASLSQLFPPVSNTRDYGEGDTIQVGTLTITVMETPGHSEGSVTLRCGNALFCGDTLFAGSMGRTDFPGGNMDKILSSLKRLAELEGNFIVYPGHMEPSTLEQERQSNPYVLHAIQHA